jgi:hypothetical protein
MKKYKKGYKVVRVFEDFPLGERMHSATYIGQMCIYQFDKATIPNREDDGPLAVFDTRAHAEAFARGVMTFVNEHMQVVPCDYEPYDGPVQYVLDKWGYKGILPDGSQFADVVVLRRT